MHNPARLVLAFVSSAVDAGATACNYIEATKFLWRGSSVCGVRAHDRLSGEEFDVRARLTLNAAGPWADYLQNDPQHFGAWHRLPYSRDAYFIVDRAPTSEYGVAVQGLSRDKDAVLGRSTRHLFAVPWRDKTLVGVWHTLFPEFPDGAHVRPDEIETWIDELNSVYPELQLSASEVSFANCGLVPFGETATADRAELRQGIAPGRSSHRARRRRSREPGRHSLYDCAGRCRTRTGSVAATAPEPAVERRHRTVAAGRRRHRGLCCV